MSSLPSLAIQAALECKWEKAIELNKQILEKDPKNIDALNRLGFAYLKSCDPKKAKKVFEKVLKIDPFNPIAAKNLKKIKKTNNQLINHKSQKICPDVFLEEPGVTKTISLVNLASKSVLSTLTPGEKVNLISKKNRIEVRNEENVYLGILPDDLSFRLRKLIRLGNNYCAFIKDVDEQKLTIIVREVKRSKRVKDASFSIRLTPDYHSSIRSELVEELLKDDTVSSDEPAEEEENEE